MTSVNGKELAVEVVGDGAWTVMVPWVRFYDGL